MAKQCANGCNISVFSKKLCRSCWAKEYQKPIKKTPLKNKAPKPIKRQTKKESKVKSKLSALKTEIELSAVQDNEYYCKGCGCSYPGLDKSHILSVGLYKHLELVRENIQLLCRRDHQIWEGGTIEQRIQLLCFEDNMKIIAKYDQEAWRKLNTEVDSYLYERLLLN